MSFSSSHITIYLFVCLFVFAPNQKGNCLFYQQFRFWKKCRFFFFHNSMITSLNSELFSDIAEFTYRIYNFWPNYFLILRSLHFAIIIFFWIIFWDCWVYILQLLLFSELFSEIDEFTFHNYNFFSNDFLILQSLHFAIIIFFLRRDKKYILRINSKLWEQSRSNLRIRSCTKLNLVFW